MIEQIFRECPVSQRWLPKKRQYTPVGSPRKRWTKEQEQQLIDIWPNVESSKAAAVITGKSQSSVLKTAKRLNLPPKCARDFWTPEKEAELSRLYPNTPNRKIAKMIGINSRKAVNSKAKRMGLKKRRPLTKVAKRTLGSFQHVPYSKPDKPVQQQRPPAVYSNRSAMGIAK